MILALIFSFLAISFKSVSFAQEIIALPSNSFSYKSDPCLAGPSFWCIPDSDNLKKCNLEEVKNVGVCGYSSRSCPVARDLKTFCNKNPRALNFGGGLTHVPAGEFGWFVLAMFWPPSFFGSNLPKYRHFLSDFNQKGTIGSRTLQLHGLWPNFASPPKSFENSKSKRNSLVHHESWSEYCTPSSVNSNSPDYSKCHVNGKLCPENTTKTQFHYDNCMVKYNIEPCVNPLKAIKPLTEDFKNYASGYLGSNGSFLLHEFTKHGSCVGGSLSADPIEFFKVGIQKAIQLRNTSSVVKFVEENRGSSVDWKDLKAVMGKNASGNCNHRCHLEEVWFCLGRKPSGEPSDDFIQCSESHLASDTCNPSRKCSRVIIPDFVKGPHLVV